MPKTHIYEVAKGNEVAPEFVGKEVALTRATTVAECLSLGQFENEDAIVAAATSQWLIGARDAIRTELGRKADAAKGETAPTLESAAALGNAFKVSAPGERKEAKPKTEKGQSRAAASDAGHKLFLRYRDDEAFAKRIDKMDATETDEASKVINPTAYAAWLKINPVAATEATQG